MNIYVALMHFRAVAEGETQNIEGWWSTVRIMTERAPLILHALVNSRLKVKLGAEMAAERLCDCHALTVEHMKSDRYRRRFQPSDATTGPDPP